MSAFDREHAILKVDQSRLVAELAVTEKAAADGIRIDAEAALEFLRDQGLANIDDVAVQAWSNQEDQSVAVVVARGSSPTPGEDGYVEYIFQHEQEEHEEQLSEAKRVDYKDWNSQLTVEKGEILARVFPPTEGTPGVDVYGEEIPAPVGRTTSLRVGRNVELEEEGRLARSTAGGLVQFRGAILEVSPTFVVQGDVNLRSGNIRFNGDVVVHGDVLENFIVEATGDVLIQKTVDKATVHADGNVVVQGGVHGKDGVDVRAGGDLTVRHAENATLSAGANVFVTHSAVHSVIKGRDVTIGKGGKGYMRGGEITATGNVVIANLGSSGTPAMSHVRLEWDRSLIQKMSTFKEERDRLLSQQQRIDEKVHRIRQAGERGGALTAKQREFVAELEDQGRALHERELQLQSERDELEDLVQRARGGTITICGEIHPDAFLSIHGKELMVDEPHGPLRLRLGKDRLEILPVASAAQS